MLEYHQIMVGNNATGRAAPGPSQIVPPPPSRDRATPAYFSVDDQFGDDAVRELSSRNRGVQNETPEQIVEREFQNYLNSPQEPDNVDILQWWHVRISFSMALLFV